jgi:filamentous hemagglutinin family protein
LLLQIREITFMKSFTTASFQRNESKRRRPDTLAAVRLRRTPLAQAAALLLMAGVAGSAHAVQPFSPAWFANKGAIQATAAATGLMPNGTPVSSLSPQGQQQAANAQLQKSIDNLAQAARGIAWQQGLQAAQRQKVLGDPSNVPNGLGVGGLDTGSLASSWVNANAPTQTTDANGNAVVDIQQTGDKAIANWNTFNVGKNTIVQFDQASADWAILNRITDPTMAPSTIEGQIRAPGTVLIVNQNGIVFTGSSQINTRNLVAAAANITDQQFTQNGIYGPDQTTPSFTNASGNLVVEEGAQIGTSAPTSATQGGGYVLLMGQQVNNAGDIETQQGQIEMAAGDNFIIRQGVGTDANQSSTTRGNEISPQFNVGSTAGQVINTLTGLLLAQEGDITLAGHDVQQNGVAVATTTVNTRGTIHLLNSASDTTGSVTLGDGAITAVVIEDDGSTALDSQRTALIDASAAQDLARPGAATGVFDNLSPLTDLEDESRIEIVSGGSVDFEGNSLTLATGGQIAVSATQRTFVADGAILDVSGQVGVNLAMSSNDVLVNVQGNELRDSPDNRDSGDLFNTNITVDRRDLIEVPAGTGGDPDERWYTANGLLEVSGYLDNQGHTIGEWAAQGGTIELNGNEVVTQTGSQINLSGGSLNVATGYVAQTWLVGSDGQLYNANSAPTDMTFTGVYKGFEVAHARWGANAAEFFYNPLIAPRQVLENGYTAGRDAGQLIVGAPTAVLEGDIIATVYNGPLQIRGRDAVDGYSQAQTAVANAGSLSFGQYGPGGLNGVSDTDIQIGNIADITTGMADDAALPLDRVNTIWLDASRLNAEGLGGLDLATGASVNIDAPLTLANGGALNIVAPTVDIAADVTARGGSISVTNILTPGSGASPVELLDVNGDAAVTLDADATLDLRGLWTNEPADPDDVSGLAGLVYINGGSLSLESTQDVTLASGSLIDVSSGGAVLTGSKTQGGSGGNVTLVSSEMFSGAIGNGTLTLDGDIRAIGVNGGGTLALTAGDILIAAAGTAPATGQLLLTPDFFSAGFSNYDITGNSGMTVADGTQLAVTVPVYRFADASFSAPTGADPAAALDVWTPPLYLENPSADTLTQRAGASLVLRSGALATGGAIDIGMGATITVDPLQSITLEGHNQITVDGALHAPGGKISVINDRILGEGTTDFDPDGMSIWIGDNAVLDVAGTAYTATDVNGRTYGLATDGGAIVLGTDQTGFDSNTSVIDSSDAFIVIRPGALLDASGAGATVDAAATLGAGASGSLALAGNGGSITMTSYDGIYADGTLRAAAGGAAAAGGTLSVTLETPLYGFGQGTPDDVLLVPRVITIAQSAQPSQLPDNLVAGVADPSLQIGQARFSVDRIEAGGFGNLSFSGRDAILFDGNVDLHASQSIAFHEGPLSDTRTDGQVTITAPYVLLGGGTTVDKDSGIYPQLQGAGATPSQQNTGTFSVAANLIDIQDSVGFGSRGSISLMDGSSVAYDFAGFNNVDLVSQGDIRFVPGQMVGASASMGAGLGTAGDLSVTAVQIYPATRVSGSFSAGAPSGNVMDGVISINRIGDTDPALPNSVFGAVTLVAGTIDQGGVIRAPLGKIQLGTDATSTTPTQSVNLEPGSITSTSANGLTIPYGGTADGVTYSYNGATVLFPFEDIGNGTVGTGVILSGNSVAVNSGAVIDVSGGGNLTGAGFVSGRGGSVDVLTTALVNANPANKFSAPGNLVYAIVPGYTGAYAPVDAGTAPGIGQQVTIPAGVPGLAAGTYTLLPARYALLPGAYRIELGKTDANAIAGAVATGTGSWLVSGTRSVGNTGIQSALPTQMVLSSGAEVRDNSQYNETSYTDFALQQAATLAQARPILPMDAGALYLSYPSMFNPDAGPALRFQGTTLFQAADGGRPGTAVIGSFSLAPDYEIVASNPTPGFDGYSFDAADLNAIGASRLVIGGIISNGQARGGSNSVTVRDGVVLSAADIILVTGDGGITLDPGAEIDTVGKGASPYDSTSGIVFDSEGYAILAVSNGNLNFIDSQTPSSAPISVGADAQIYSEGTISFSTAGTIAIDPTVRFGTRNLGLNVGTINVGDAAGMAGAIVPQGLLLSQDFLNRLLAGDTSIGAPALQMLTLSASQSFNVFGSVDLSVINPATGKADLDLVLNTPAIYGYGSAGDNATLTVGTLTWSGMEVGVPDTTGTLNFHSTAPGAIVAGGPGTGAGTFNIVADKIVFGYPDTAPPDNAISLGRLMAGFSNVNLEAGEISSNNKNTLSVYQVAPVASGAPGIGGNLNLVTSMLTADAGAVMAYTIGGALTVSAPAGGSPAGQGAPAALGGEIDLNAASIDVSSAIVLPSGKLAMTADGDIALQAGSRLDLAGRTVTLFDQTLYGFGGDLTMDSDNGNVTQQAGAVIDVSADKNAAGSVTANAANGTAQFNGQIFGGSADGFASGAFSITGQSIGDFNALNAMLTAGNVFGSRSFDLKQGDLMVGDGVKADDVEISVDDGSLTVNGAIDASGAAPGTIRLAAHNDLTLASTAVLDAHGTVLQVDSYGEPIEAKNRGSVELSTAQGTLRLNPGATIDVSVTSPYGVLLGSYGQIDLDAPRGAVGTATTPDDADDAGGDIVGDIRIDASGPLTIKGAQSIAVNAFWTYKPTDPYGTILQDNGEGANGDAVSATTGYLGMNQVDARSQTFMTAALADGDLLSRLSGLSFYADAFHLRPGVEIDSNTPNGTLTVAGDLDLSGFRYNSLNPLFQKTGVYGSGEPGALVIRAGGDLDIVGSISDGFAPAPATLDDNDWQIGAGVQGSDVETLLPIPILSGSTFPNTPGVSLRFAIPIQAGTLNANAVIPVQVALADPFTVPAGTRLTAPIFDGSGNQLYASGTVMPANTVLPAGARLGAGSVMPGNVDIAAMTWPAGASLGVFAAAVVLASNIDIPFEGIVPTGANLQLAAGDSAPTRPIGASGQQGTNVTVAPMLPEGDLSFSLRLIAGADLGAADTRIVKPAGVLKAVGASGNLTLSDNHVQETSERTFIYYDNYGDPGTTFYYSHYTQYGPGFPPFCSYASCTPGPTVTVRGQTVASAVRTGTGDLDMIAGGSFDEASLYGVYTAGTQSKTLAADGSVLSGGPAASAFNQPRGPLTDTDYDAAMAVSQAWYPDHGGNVLVSAQGDMNGFMLPGNTIINFSTIGNSDTNLVGNWLSGQGGNGLPSAWSINFGTYEAPFSTVLPVAFTGLGTLGGGNLDVNVGGNAGKINASASGLNLTVASTGRVLADGTVVETGGGDLTVKIGGALNPVNDTSRIGSDDVGGTITDLRGNISIDAGSIGTIVRQYSTVTAGDVPQGDTFAAASGAAFGGVIVVPGDGIADLSTRGDLVLAGAGNAGRVGATGTFNLWTNATAIDLFSAGGGVTPSQQLASVSTTSAGTNDAYMRNDHYMFPGSLSLEAASGDIFFQSSQGPQGVYEPIELSPSPQGQLDMLAAGSIFNGAIDMSGASTSYTMGAATSFTPNGFGLDFGADTPTGDLHAGDHQPIRIYAGNDIVNLQFGEVITFGFLQPETPSIWYIGAKSAQIRAGDDIVDAGSPYDVTPGPTVTSVTGFVLNLDPSDVSVMSAGGDIFFSSMQVAGPGLLEVQAGGNYYAADKASLNSIGPVFDVNQGNRNSGAGITLMAGVGAAGPDYADFAKLYFNAANQAAAGVPDTDPANAGKVPMTYADQLYAWLQQRFGYAGSTADALAYFLALPNEQQGVFVRQVYFEELDAGGKEFNDPSSKRFQSYLRGRDAIAALFPSVDAQGNVIAYQGDITLFGNSGIHTDFGGTIQTLTPGGQTLVGVEGANPPGTAGVVTQGSGDIDMYSLGSILLGQSRVMTTFGGDILAWSATGDINAGRGSKTTQVFTPPRLVYNDLGDVTLSPDVPSAGAGFATLDPIPEVAPGDMNLIAPLGTIDAGEAGIRVSGNINLAALQVVNAANIVVQGKSTGIPMIAEVNVGALTNASAAASQAAMAAQDVVQRERAAARQALPSIFTVRVLGFGSDTAGAGAGETGGNGDGADMQPVSYDPRSTVRVLGVGELPDAARRQLTERERSNLGGL